MSVAVELSGVPETLLWTLYHRAEEARRPDAVLKDPLAVELVDQIDYPFDARFGASGWRARWQALRALRFDIEVRRFLAARPGATVVALGEGLETQFWRVDDGRVRWVTVELPETVSAVGGLLPSSPRRRVIAASALDAAWLDEVAGPDVMVTAQGLLMYLERSDADALIARIASRLPGGAMVFDTVPFWASKATMSGKMKTADGYTPPPMPWGSRRGELARVAALSPAIRDVHRLRLPRADDRAFGLVAPALARVAPSLLPQTLALRFAAEPARRPSVAGERKAVRGCGSDCLPADDRFSRVGVGGGSTLFTYVELSAATPFVRSADVGARDRFAR